MRVQAEPRLGRSVSVAMVGAAPTQATTSRSNRCTRSCACPRGRRFPCARLDVRPDACGSSAPRSVPPSPSPGRFRPAIATHGEISRAQGLWAVQLRPGTPGWLDARSVRVLRAQGVNALVLDVQRLGRSRGQRGWSTRRVASRCARASCSSPSSRVAIAMRRVRCATRSTACARHARGLRCATGVGGLGAAVALAKRHRYVAVSLPARAGSPSYPAHCPPFPGTCS